MQVTKHMVQKEYDNLKLRDLRKHDLKTIAAMHPEFNVRAAATFLLREVV